MAHETVCMLPMWQNMKDAITMDGRQTVQSTLIDDNKAVARKPTF